MHYKNGREAHEGDPVIGESYKGSGTMIAGKLHSLQLAATACNAQLAHPVYGSCANYCVTVGELIHAEDAFKAIDNLLALAAAPPPAEPAATTA